MQSSLKHFFFIEKRSISVWGLSDCYRREELLDQIHKSPPLKDIGVWKQGNLANIQRGNTLTPHFSQGKDAPAVSGFPCLAHGGKLSNLNRDVSLSVQSPLLAPLFKRRSLDGWMCNRCDIFKALERGRALAARPRSGPADRLSSDLKRRRHNEPHITTSAEKPRRNPIIIT